MKKLILLALFAVGAMPSFGQTVVDVSKTEKTTENGAEIITFQGKPLTGTLTEKHPDGKPKSWINLRDGLANGSWQEWYPNGQLKFNAYWSMGKGPGLWEYYHEIGMLRQEE